MTKEGLITSVNVIFSDKVEQSYIHESSLSDRKKYGQFFTPFRIAEFMSNWVINGRNEIRLLDPGSGTLVFERAIHNLYPGHKFSVDCYELDGHILEFSKKYRQMLTAFNIHFLNKDYLLSNWQDKYDGIICNPPYYKHHRIEAKELINKTFYQQTNYKFSLSTNVHCLFLIKSINQLNKNGKLSYIMPSEFLNSNYGVAVKNYLVKCGFVRYIIAFDYNVSVFPEALTTACIILLSNNEDNGCPIKFVSLKRLEDIEELPDLLRGKESKNLQTRDYLPVELPPKIKWKNYFADQHQFEMLVPFSKYAKVMRGIATGANKYFTLSKEGVVKRQIDSIFLEPCITKANDANSIIFTKKMFNKLRNEGKRCNLLFLNGKELNDQVKKYLEYGVKIGVNEKYLPSHRNPWYYSETRKPSPIWVTVFSRKGLRFVRNETNVLNLTCFHCVYLTEKGAENIALLMAYLISPICQEVFFKQKREYGNGLDKFEPNDLNQSQIIDVEKLRKDLRELIEEKYRMVREMVLTGRKEESYNIIQELDSIFRMLLGGGIDTYILHPKLL